MKAIDLFAGLGGFTEGARMAGVDVIWAANHWKKAVQWHSANHPETIHVCQDLHQVAWETLPPHDTGLMSPCCQGHADAKGKEKPGSDTSRATAWACVAYMEYHRPYRGILENVPEFMRWELYPAWKMAMEQLGYTLTPLIIDAADFGVPQHRVRMFMILSRGDKARTTEQWMQDLKPHMRPHVPVANIIEWDRYKWSAVNKPRRSLKTLARIERGRRDVGPRFVMPYYGSGSGETGRSLDRPLGTVTTRDRWAVVDGDRMRMLQPTEYRAAMGFPDTYQLPKVRKLAIHLLGNAVCPPVPAALIPLLN